MVKNIEKKKLGSKITMCLVALVCLIITITSVACTSRASVYNKLVKSLKENGTYSATDNEWSVTTYNDDYDCIISVNLDTDSISLFYVDTKSKNATMGILLNKNETEKYNWVYSYGYYGTLSGYIDLDYGYDDENFVIVEDYAKTPTYLKNTLYNLCDVTVKLCLINFKKYLLLNDIADDLTSFGIKF